MAKSADAFRTISEVAEWLEVPAHVLRFWESKFSQIKPVKRAGGRRYYRPADMLLLGGIKALLHDEGMTIKGVQKLLREQGVRHVSGLSQPLDEVTEGEVSDIALDVTPEPPEPAKVLNFGRGGGEAPVTPPKIAADSEADSTVADDEGARPAPSLPAATDMPIPQDALFPHDAPSASLSAPEPDQPASEQTDQHEIAEAQAEPAEEPAPQGRSAASKTQAEPAAEPEIEAEIASEAASIEPEVTHEPSPSEPVEGDSPKSAPEPEPVLEAQPEEASEPEPTAGPTPLPQPDLPEDASDKVSADPGLLAALADLPRPISTETAARLGPLLARLSALGAAKSQDGQLRD